MLQMLKRVISVDEARIISQIGTVEAQYRTAVLNAVAAAKRAPGTLKQLAAMIESGRVEEALDAAARAGAIRIADQYAAVFVTAGQEAAEGLTDILDVTVGFDQVNERAVAHMQHERLRLIREFADEQKQATRLALSDGIQRGANPIEQARAFRGSIGLTSRQQQSVLNFRRYLEQAASGDTSALSRTLRDRRFDPTIRRALRTGEPLSAEQIERMTARYRERYVKYRSEVIARTEALRAVHVGQDEAMHQAVDDGLIDRESMERTWITSRDGRERESHALLNGQKRGLDETFPGLAGELRYPGDPNAPAAETIQCRCGLAIRIKSLKRD